jgi:flagellar M-ring protein FliF
MLEYQQTVERRLEERAQSMLDRALGASNSMVRVTAEINFDQRERIEQAVDPNGSVVVSEQSSNERGSTESTAGVPGVASNLQAAQPKVTATPSSQAQETINYEMSRITSKLVESVGALKTLSVSVLVADKTVPGAEGAEPRSTPREATELQEIEMMVRSALGLNDSRGDVLTVVSMPFETGFIDEPLPAPSPINNLYTYLPFIKYGLLSIGALMAYLLFLRPLLRTMRGAAAQAEPMKTVRELEAELQSGVPMLGGPGDPLAQIRKEVLGGDMAPVQVVKSWMREEVS